MSKSAVKISLDLLSNPLCEQDQDFLNMVTALDTAMKRMDAFNQEKVPGVGSPPSRGFCLEEHLHGVLNRAQAPLGPSALRGLCALSRGLLSVAATSSRHAQ